MLAVVHCLWLLRGMADGDLFAFVLAYLRGAEHCDTGWPAPHHLHYTTASSAIAWHAPVVRETGCLMAGGPHPCFERGVHAVKLGH